jgi:hypothetical protein
MHLRRVAGTIAVSTLWACGLDLTGLGPIPEAAVSAPDHTVPASDASSADPMTGSFSTGADPLGDASAPATAVDAALATADASDDATSSTLAPADAAAADGPMGPCQRLAACCPRLLVPELVLPCLVGAMEDAGDMACETGLASLADAGVCP